MFLTPMLARLRRNLYRQEQMCNLGRGSSDYCRRFASSDYLIVPKLNKQSDKVLWQVKSKQAILRSRSTKWWDLGWIPRSSLLSLSSIRLDHETDMSRNWHGMKVTFFQGLEGRVFFWFELSLIFYGKVQQDKFPRWCPAKKINNVHQNRFPGRCSLW